MKFTIPARELDHALDGMLRVLPRKTRMPVLNGIDARTEDGRVVLRAGDLDTAVSYTCVSAVATEGGRCVFADARRLRQLVRHARNDEVHVRTNALQELGMVRMADFLLLALIAQQRSHILGQSDFPVSLPQQ